ncbi:hypothetical protein H5410_019487 [Solanum commersonii]|uniref:Uncharacterized protein n=1 Tax=Solanum commersonii TaxID=4109 RepID=A0A9J5ZBB8_SOLCO|nr:hypothetical protein H5410_019487 [Solanum commersonii]
MSLLQLVKATMEVMGKRLNSAKRGKRGCEGLTLGVVERDFQVCSAIYSLNFGVRVKKKKNAVYRGGVVWF